MNNNMDAVDAHSSYELYLENQLAANAIEANAKTKELHDLLRDLSEGKSGSRAKHKIRKERMDLARYSRRLRAWVAHYDNYYSSLVTGKAENLKDLCLFQLEVIAELDSSLCSIAYDLGRPYVGEIRKYLLILVLAAIVTTLFVLGVVGQFMDGVAIFEVARTNFFPALTLMVAFMTPVIVGWEAIRGWWSKEARDAEGKRQDAT